jgi:predicted ATPase
MGNSTVVNRVRVDGFKSIRHLDLELGPLNVLVGANGAGKSNLIAVFTLLNELMEERLQEYVARSGGAEALLFMGSKETPKIKLEFAFGLNEYVCELVPAAGDKLIIANEECQYQREGFDRPYTVTTARGQLETGVPLSAEFAQEPVVKHVFASIQEWIVYHFQDTTDSALVKKTGSIHDTARLRRDASNLAAYLRSLRSSVPATYSRIRDTIRLVAPFFDDFVLDPVSENPETIRLQWRQKGLDRYLDASALSDGTLRFMCLATVLLQPNPPATIFLDEPELGLHPYAINVLAGLLRSASVKTRIIIATQSVTLVNQFEPENIIVVDRQDQESKFKRLDTAALGTWLEDYSLGQLWEKNVIGGQP